MGRARSGQVRSGQVRVFNVHIQRKLLCPGQEKKEEGKRGKPPPLGGTKEYQQSDRGRQQSDRGRQQAEGITVLWNLECPVGLSQKGNLCAFQ